jgi:hypothetical protein
LRQADPHIVYLLHPAGSAMVVHVLFLNFTCSPFAQSCLNMSRLAAVLQVARAGGEGAQQGAD